MTPIGKHVVAIGEGKPKSGSRNALSPIYRRVQSCKVLLHARAVWSLMMQTGVIRHHL